MLAVLGDDQPIPGEDGRSAARMISRPARAVVAEARDVAAALVEQPGTEQNERQCERKRERHFHRGERAQSVRRGRVETRRPEICEGETLTVPSGGLSPAALLARRVAIK